MSNMDKLYHEIIKQHHKQPYHFSKVEDAMMSIRANNPICGDRFDIFIEVENKVFKTLHFHGFGCAISKASSSIMLQLLEGKPFSEAEGICKNFLAYIHNTLNEPVYHTDFKAFSALHEQTARLDCAALSWLEILRFLEEKMK
ncbi:MAG: Fe-S cluster assembly sulfur transfer protein SufU [Bacteroidota bacterium]